MAGIPVGTAAILFVGALIVGFIWGSRSGHTGRSVSLLISGDPTNNFTPAAQRVLVLAREEAGRFNHNFVGTEHMLLGLIKHGKGVAVNVLKKVGLDLDMLRMEIEKLVGTGPEQKISGDIPYTPRLKKALSLAAKEAKALNHTYVGTEHILLGLLREGDGVAARVLKNMNVDIEQTRLEILKELDPNFQS
jgi:ATP-dependent Clp protease ATP-binding subunit ClpC